MQPQETKLENQDGSNTIPFYTLTVPAARLRDTAFRNKNVVFKFFISDLVSMHGWALKKLQPTPHNPHDQFDTSPDIKLEPKDRTDLGFGSGLYLGNQILYSNTLKDILREVGNRNMTILFSPELNGNQSIYYRISLLSESGIKVDFDGTYETNPSPPRNSYDE